MTDQQNTAQENAETPPTPEELHAILVERFNQSMRKTAAEIQSLLRDRIGEGLNPGAASAAASLVAADLLGAIAIERESSVAAESAEEHGELLLANMVDDMKVRLTASIAFYRSVRADFEKTMNAMTPVLAANDEATEGDANAA